MKETQRLTTGCGWSGRAGRMRLMLATVGLDWTAEKRKRQTEYRRELSKQLSFSVSPSERPVILLSLLMG